MAQGILFIELPSGNLWKFHTPVTFPLHEFVKKFNNVFMAWGYDGKTEEIYIGKIINGKHR